MPDIHQYAQESLEEELEAEEPVFASAPMPDPLGEEAALPPASPPMDSMPLPREIADLEVPQSFTAQDFDLPMAQGETSTSFDLRIPPMASGTEFDLPSRPRPAVKEFDLPLGTPSASQIELLGTPVPNRPRDFHLPMNRPEGSQQEPLDVMVREQRQYSDMSMRDFFAEHQAEEGLPLPGRSQSDHSPLPLPERNQSDYEPFPLPERRQSPEARLETPFVQSPPGQSEMGSETPEPSAERTADFFPEHPQNDRITRHELREEMQRDQQLRFLSRFE